MKPTKQKWHKLCTKILKILVTCGMHIKSLKSVQLVRSVRAAVAGAPLETSGTGPARGRPAGRCRGGHSTATPLQTLGSATPRYVLGESLEGFLLLRWQRLPRVGRHPHHLRTTQWRALVALAERLHVVHVRTPGRLSHHTGLRLPYYRWWLHLLTSLGSKQQGGTMNL